MGKKMRYLIGFLAGVGWAVAVGITIGTLLWETVSDYPFFFGRVFALAALVASVLTVVLWLDRTSLPTTTAVNAGIQAGIPLGVMKERAAEAVRRNDPFTALTERIMESEGPQEQRPAGWRRW